MFFVILPQMQVKLEQSPQVLFSKLKVNNRQFGYNLSYLIKEFNGYEFCNVA
jgi:hypothetical protein